VFPFLPSLGPDRVVPSFFLFSCLPGTVFFWCKFDAFFSQRLSSFFSIRRFYVFIVPFLSVTDGNERLSFFSRRCCLPPPPFFFSFRHPPKARFFGVFILVGVLGTLSNDGGAVLSPSFFFEDASLPIFPLFFLQAWFTPPPSLDFDPFLSKTDGAVLLLPPFLRPHFLAQTPFVFPKVG